MLNKSAIVAGLAAASMVIAPVAVAAPSKSSAMKLSLAGARASTPSKSAQKMGGGNVLWLVLAAAGLGGIIYAATHHSSP